MFYTHDAIVVGGRVAGAATGMLLARAGLDVLVVDRARYGSDTFSTHAFMRAGVLQLSKWGLLGEIVDAGTPAVRRTTVRYGRDEEVIDIKPIPGCEALYAPRRWLLDRVLIDAAANAGADVRMGTGVVHLLRRDDGSVHGIEVRDHTGLRYSASAPITIGADGAKSLVAKSVAAPTYRQGDHAAAFIGSWFSGVESDGYQWLYNLGGSAGIIPTNDGQVSAWVAMPSTRFPVARQLPNKGFWPTFDHVAPDWAERLRSGVQHGPFRAFPGIPSYLRQPYGPGWALVGDAGYFKDPITAHGMTDALRDAELLANAVVRGLGSGRLVEEFEDYRTTRDRLSLDLVALADRVASFDWDLDELRELLPDMSTAMRPEIAHLSELAPATT
ncbi:MAG: NAD(P)/FAD-dependent oxidoreductase [Nitriliruptorales bacterium]|nr:NAD(P)/FAD-dependent oxidoreductase [Nitriliruptorales bacterium]